MASRAPEWAIATSLVATTAGIVGAALVAAVMSARKLLGMGATPEQVAAIIDRKINGSLGRIEAAVTDLRGELKAVDAKVDALDDKVDVRHAENREAVGELRGALGARIGRRQWPPLAPSA